MKYMHPESDEAKAADAQRLAHEKALERRAWRTLWHTYERCVEISELVWSKKLETASAQQQALAEQMRDRLIEDPSWPGPMHHEIPVPLFTPRDRAQFLKEAAATLLISADRQSLTVHFPKEKPGASEESQAPQGPGVEAASGTSEETMEPEATASP